jgi:hypothetical protein
VYSLKAHSAIAVEDSGRGWRSAETRSGSFSYFEATAGALYGPGEGTDFLLFETPSAGTA